MYIYIYTYSIIAHTHTVLLHPNAPVPLRMRAYDKAKTDPNIKNVCAHVASLKLKGYYRCCEFAWKKKRKADHWGLLCDACPKLAKAYKEIPNVLREMLGKGPKLWHRSSSEPSEIPTTCILPGLFERTVVNCIAPRKAGTRGRELRSF